MHDTGHGHDAGARGSQRLMPTGPDGYGDASQLDSHMHGHEDAKPAAPPLAGVGLSRGAASSGRGGGSAVLAGRGGVASAPSGGVAYTPPSAAGADDGDLGGGRVFFSDARA